MRLIRRLRGPHFVDAPELKRRLEHGDKLTLIDVRGPEEFRGPLGHIASAIDIPLCDLQGGLARLRETEGPIVTI